MRIVLLSDTHSYHRSVKVPDGDVLIHAGDFTTCGEATVVNDFAHWLDDLPHKYKLVTPGNHDMRFESRRPLLKNSCTVLIDEAAIIDGVKFYGSPFTPTFGSWAYMLPRGSTTLLDKWLKIPTDTDVLITHGPPQGILDQSVPGRGDHLGDFDLGLVVKSIEPKLHVFGHIHGGYGEYQPGRTRYVNAAICDEAYKPVRKPVVVEL